MSEDVEALVKREVSAARAILREDKLLASHGKIQAKLDKHFPDDPPQDKENDNGSPKPPAKKDTPEEGTGKKPGIWWGPGTVPGE